MWLNSSWESNGTFEAESSKQLILSSAVSLRGSAWKQAVLDSEVDADLRGQAHEQLIDLIEVSDSGEAENNSVAEGVGDAVIGDWGGSAVVPDVLEEHVDGSAKQGYEETPKLPEKEKVEILQRWVIEEYDEVLHHEWGAGLRGDHCQGNDAKYCFIISSHSLLIDKYQFN